MRHMVWHKLRFTHRLHPRGLESSMPMMQIWRCTDYLRLLGCISTGLCKPVCGWSALLHPHTSPTSWCSSCICGDASHPVHQQDHPCIHINQIMFDILEFNEELTNMLAPPPSNCFQCKLDPNLPTFSTNSDNPPTLLFARIACHALIQKKQSKYDLSGLELGL
jgi:hypothetical protein